MTIRSIIILSSLLFSFALSNAQPEIRKEDHFWRKRVVNRMDLNEKINRPLVRHDQGYYMDIGYTENDGMISALMNGLKEGRFVAYDPDDFSKVLDWAKVSHKIRRLNSIDDRTKLEEVWRNEETWNDLDAFDQGQNPTKISTEEAKKELDLSAFEETFQYVEDIIFDKNRSMMVYEIDHFQVIWTDPRGVLPEIIIASFKYDDIKDVLEKTCWRTRFNDAESRSVKEVFELRIFNSYLIQYGGEPINSLAEAQKRRHEIMEFEHHLWSY